MEFSLEYFTETLLCYFFAFCYSIYCFVEKNKHTSLAENSDNLISADLE